jgi:phosphoglycerol transferase
MLDRIGRRVNSRALRFGLLMVILVAGFLDQTTVRFVPDYRGLAARDSSEGQFVGWIEASLPKGAAVFELPWMVFPEAHPFERLEIYDLLAGYLHSNTLRWSFGAMRGRANAQWQERLAAEVSAAGANATYSPDAALAARARLEGPLRTLVLDGFDGIYIDRYGYADQADPLIAALSQTLGISPLLSPDQRLAFFNLTGFAQSLTSGIAGRQLKALRTAAMPCCDASPE